MRAEIVRHELKEIAGIFDGLKLDILETLYTCGDCTEHQIFALIDAEESRIKETLKELETKLIVRRKTANLHPLELEDIYSLSGKGIRIYSLLRSLAEREVALWENFKKVWR
ncbi:hypothetical protein DRO97_10545 [Archaeoglobales archaeon]|nr:MAG: hypothetical protein DRO97_10545 [Archaeoglobales archaeon]